MKKPTSSEIWRYNGLLGSLSIFQSALDCMLRSNLCTERTKNLVKQIQPLVNELRQSLKVRTDHEQKEVSSAEVK